MADKEHVVKSLLSSTQIAAANGNGSKIQVLGEEEPSSKEEGPTMMEMMMAAQAEATKAKRAQRAVEEKQMETKPLGGGFKKGFFDSKPKKNPKPAPTTSAPASSTQVTKSTPDLPTIKKNTDKKQSLVLDEVQSAMREEANPMMQALQKGDWATPELIQEMKSNRIIASGLQNPKCTAAIQYLQSNPKEAFERFRHDADVTAFLQEFCAMMGRHFEALGKQQQQPQQAPAKMVDELGPLQAEVLKNKGNQPAVPPDDAEQARVQEILQDEELRTILMDAEMQRVLQECGDPVKFAKHMRDPVIAYKIKKLHQAGLVGTAK